MNKQTDVIILGNKHYRKGHPLVYYNATLNVVLAHSYSLPVKWGDYKPREILQELLFILVESIYSRTPRNQEVGIQEISTLMVSQTEHITGNLEPLKNKIRCTESNYDLYQLYTSSKLAETSCIAAKDYIELEAKGLAENTIYILDKAAEALDKASSWIFAFLLVFSSNEDGSLKKETKWIPWEESKIRSLNV